MRPRWSKKGERDAGVKRAERRDPKGKGEKGYSNLKRGDERVRVRVSERTNE